jgi:hypothetical protein
MLIVDWLWRTLSFLAPFFGRTGSYFASFRFREVVAPRGQRRRKSDLLIPQRLLDLFHNELVIGDRPVHGKADKGVVGYGSLDQKATMMLGLDLVHNLPRDAVLVVVTASRQIITPSLVD